MLAAAALVALAAGQAPTPRPEVCHGDQALCDRLQAACPASYSVGTLITPYPVPESADSGPCSSGEGAEPSSTGGSRCRTGWMCDINNITGGVTNHTAIPGDTVQNFADACVQCPPGTCCVTMQADNLTHGLAETAGALNPAAALLHPQDVRLTGAVMVYQKPCPRNYKCPVGRVDDAKMVGKGRKAGEQCVSQMCKVYEGCPEGTTVPDSGSQKFFAFFASLVWFGVVRLLRFAHRKSRDRRLKQTRSARNLQLDHSASLAELGTGLLASPVSAEALDDGGGEMERTVSLWAQVRANWQESGLRSNGLTNSGLDEAGICDTDYADDDRAGGALARGNSVPLEPSPSIVDTDELLGALEAKAAALVQVGGKVKGLNLEFSDLALTLANGKKLLNGVTGTLPSGRLCAIMGPSGAGKTTFLYTLCGKATYGTMSGELKINGEACGVDAYRASFGFVPQEDVMLRTMTVSEICHFYANMRLPPHFSALQRSQVAETVIDVLGMSHVQDSKIGDEETRGISGGQRKRVNIAMEMVGKPSILLLDEPTSGLDATSSLQLVKALRATAKQGICVAAVLHQPRYEMFCLFHDVLLLGKGGFTVYLGPAFKAKEYFESLGYSFPPQCNPADHIMDIIGGEVPHDAQDPSLDCAALQESGQSLATKWEQDTVFNTHVSSTAAAAGSEGDGEDAKTRKNADFFQQLMHYTKRGFVQQYRPFNTVLVDYSLIFIAGALLGLSQRNTELKQLPISGALSGLAIGLTTIISSTRCFGNERIVFWREAAAGMSKPAYFIGKTIAEIPRLFFIPGFYLVIFTAVTGSNDHHVDEYWILLFAVWAVSGWGYLVSVLVKPLNSQLAGVLVVLISLMLNGVFVPKHRLGRLNDYDIPQLSFAFHMSKALYLLKEASFTDFQVPNLDAVKFDVSNACPLDQACMGWVSIMDQIRDNYGWGPACGLNGVDAAHPLCPSEGHDVSGPPGGQIPGSSLTWMFAIGIMTRVLCFVALVGTNRHQQV